MALRAFSPDGQRAASVAGDGQIVLWDAASGEEIIRHEGDWGMVGGVAFSPDGQFIVTASEDGIIRRWAVAEAALTQWVEQNRYIRPFTPNECQRYLLECTDPAEQ